MRFTLAQVVLMLAFTAQFSAGDNVTVISNVDLNVVSFNETVILICTGGGGSNDTFQWEKDGAVLDGETSDTLTLVSVDASLGGDYMCTVSNTARNESANTTLYVAPYIITPLEGQILKGIGSFLNITCEAGGFPVPDVSWVRVNNDMTLTQVSNTSLLNLFPVSFSSAGVYHCLAIAEINGVIYNATNETTLFVSPAGSVIVYTEEQIPNLGENITLICSGLGGPNDSFAWERNGEVISGENENQLTLTNFNTSSGGIYTCTVSNAAGSGSASASLYVLPFIITPLEEQILTVIESSVNITCEAGGFPVPDVSWVRVSNDMTLTQVSNMSLLNLFPVSFSSAGVYHCLAIAEVNGVMYNATNETTLFVSPAGNVNVCTEEQIPNLGENITLTCLVRGGPNNSFAWKRNGEVISGENENQLTLMNFNTSSGGVYTCTVSNAAGSGSASTTLYVLPFIVTPLEEQILTMNGSNMNISCDADGFPNPTVSWVDMTNAEVVSTSLLEFSPVIFGDEGLYRCVATAEIDNMNFNATDDIILVVSPESSVKVSPLNMVYSQGSDITLICTSFGGPDNFFQWEKNGNIIGNDSMLKVMDVDASSGGVYTCTVSNAAGSDSASTTLYVAPYIVTPLEEQTLTTNGSNMSISCDADGFPSPTVIWVDMTDAEVVSTSLLEFSPVMFGDEGLYRCVATAEINRMNFSTTDETILIVSPESSVNVSPLNMVFNQRNDITFICSALGSLNNTFQWKMNGNIIGNDSMLEVMDIDTSSGGIYTCIVSNAAGSDSASTTLYVAPYIVTPLEEQTLTTNGSNVSISCDADGFPNPSVSWVDMTNAEVVSTSLLEFSPVMFGDEGLYRCMATAEINNMNFNATDDIILVVSPESSVKVSPLNMVYSQGSDITLICTSFGGPDNLFQWEKNGNIIGNDSMLKVMDVDAFSGGVYTCTVSNAAGSDSASTTLYVAPYIVTPLEEQTLTTNGSNVSISCDADGFPSPTVSWVDMTDAEVVSTSLLEFSPVMFGDEGLYRCVATAEINRMNFSTTDETILIVSPESSVNVSPLNMVFNQRNDITFICSALGGLNNTFQWKMNGNIIGNDSMLEVMDIDASSGGVYTCIVSNAAGSDSASTTLYVAPYIVTPLEEQTLTTNGSNVSISCDADGFPSPTVSWVDMTNAEVVSSSLLEFSPVMFGDEGLYRCVATAEINRMNFSTTDETILIVSPESSLNVSPLNMVFTQRNDITFICGALGGPNNVFQWKMNGKIIGNDSMLEVMDIDASSGGVYTCTVSNAAGRDSASTTLYVAPYIVTPLEEQTLTFNGSSINLACEADGFPLPTVSWNRNTTGVAASNDSELIIPTVTFGQEGVYRCLANVTINGVEYEDSDITTIIVSTEGSVMVNQVDRVFTRGENATLTCISMGGPGNVYQWEKDGNIVATDDVLTLMDIDACLGGIYTCTVSNLAGNDSATTRLYVAPYFVIHPENVETSNSSKVNISCLAESFPEPEYMWMKDGDSSMIRDGVTRVDMPNSLVFRPVLFGDEGVYVCVAFITIDMVVCNESSDTAILTVSPQGSIQVNPIAINGNDSGIAMFTCMALGGPGNMFSWTKIRNNRTVMNDSELMLVDIVASDGGVYQCTVENLAGSENDTITLNVSPVVTEHPRNQNVTSFEGNIMLSCMATGFAAPTITWFHNNSMEDNALYISEMINAYTTRSTFIMSMPATSDSGLYFCRAAIDGYDEVDSSRVTILVQDVPEQPQNITAVEIQSRYLVLMWMEPHNNNAPILGYFVSYHQPVFAGGERIILTVSKEVVNVTNLLPGVIYNFTVIAYNDIGNSTASETIHLRTLEEVVSPDPNRTAAIIGGATGATLGILLLAIIIAIIAVRAKYIRGQAMARMSEMELHFHNVAADLQQHEECNDNDQETQFYAESIDSSTSEDSDATPVVEVSTTYTIHCQ